MPKNDQYMQQTVLCSTGAFIGRVNGRDYRLAVQYGPLLECDGLEVMVFRHWYGELNTVADRLKDAGLYCPVIHADKQIGDWMSSAAPEAMTECLSIWEKNLRFANRLGASKAVVHIWGVPDSDARMEEITDRVGRLYNMAQAYGVDMLPENCFCIHGSPLEHFYKLLQRYPVMGMTVDTRPAQFHNELPEIMKSGLIQSGHIRHWHINDYMGGYKQWDAMYPIPKPGTGRVDFPYFFDSLKSAGYVGTLTMETPSMIPDGVDTRTLNQSLRWLREGLFG